jgi:hypothetical protein
MLIQDAQREIRTVFVGGFWGQLISSILWLVAAALGSWRTSHESIFVVVVGGFFIFPLTQLMLRLSGAPPVTKDNPLTALGMQVAFVLPFTMLLLVPVTAYRLTLFFPAMLILVGAHYLPFAFLYGMRAFLALAAILIASGVVVALFFKTSFSLGAWIGAVVLFIFALIGKAAVSGAS